LLERKAMNKSLTYPEIAVLFAYTKEIVKEEILASDVPEDPSLATIIVTAFPASLVKRYGPQLESHSLRREIIATQLSNSMINEMGITFVYRLYDETGASSPAIARAYSAARLVFGLPEIWDEIEKLDLKVPTLIQYDMMAEVARLVRRATRWFLRHRRVKFDLAETINQFSKGIDELANQLESALIGIGKEKVRLGTQHYIDAGVPELLARRVARSRAMFSALDIIEASNQYELPITDLSHVYFTITERLDLIWFRDQINDFPVETHWDALAREAIRDDLDLQIRDLSIGVLHHKSKQKDMQGRIETWEARHNLLIDRWHAMVANLRGSGNLNFTKLSVAMRELLDLTQTSFHVSNVTRKEQKG
jgi:glutamate dehydrogenase